MLQVTARIAIAEHEIVETFLRASGPGGQNVQKVETAVQLRFDIAGSPNLPDDVKRRAAALAGRRLTKDGVLVIAAQRHRSRERNREDALARLVALLRAAAAPPPPKRRATRPTRAARERRLAVKTRTARIKAMRGKPERDD